MSEMKEPINILELAEKYAEEAYQAFLKNTPMFYNARTHWMKDDFRHGFLKAFEYLSGTNDALKTKCEELEAALKIAHDVAYSRKLEKQRLEAKLAEAREVIEFAESKFKSLYYDRHSGDVPAWQKCRDWLSKNGGKDE